MKEDKEIKVELELDDESKAKLKKRLAELEGIADELYQQKEQYIEQESDYRKRKSVYLKKIQDYEWRISSLIKYDNDKKKEIENSENRIIGYNKEINELDEERAGLDSEIKNKLDELDKLKKSDDDEFEKQRLYYLDKSAEADYLEKTLLDLEGSKLMKYIKMAEKASGKFLKKAGKWLGVGLDYSSIGIVHAAKSPYYAYKGASYVYKEVYKDSSLDDAVSESLKFFREHWIGASATVAGIGGIVAQSIFSHPAPILVNGAIGAAVAYLFIDDEPELGLIASNIGANIGGGIGFGAYHLLESIGFNGAISGCFAIPFIALSCMIASEVNKK